MKNVLTAVLFACVLYTGYSIAFADEPVYTNHIVIVSSGDTLWDIAGRNTTAGEDVREVMFRIAEANGLHNKHIYPGQALRVPLRSVDEGLYLAKR